MRLTVSKPLATSLKDWQPIHSYTTQWPLKMWLKSATYYIYVHQCCWKPQNVTSGYCCQLLPKQLSLPEYWALCKLCWVLVSSFWKRKKRCNKQTIGFKSANILRVLMDAWSHCCWLLTIYKPESVPCTNDKAPAL